jgi:hypothetical protein
MANRGGFFDRAQFTSSGWNFLTILWKSAATGAVPTSYPGGYIRASDEFTIPVRTGTGAYTIPLTSQWAGPCFGLIPYLLQATYSASGACQIQLVEDKSNNATTQEVKILITNAAGAAVDPTTNDLIGFTLLTQLFDAFA